MLDREASSPKSLPPQHTIPQTGAKPNDTSPSLSSTCLVLSGLKRAYLGVRGQSPSATSFLLSSWRSIAHQPQPECLACQAAGFRCASCRAETDPGDYHRHVVSHTICRGTCHGVCGTWRLPMATAELGRNRSLGCLPDAGGNLTLMQRSLSKQNLGGPLNAATIDPMIENSPSLP